MKVSIEAGCPVSPATDIPLTSLHAATDVIDHVFGVPPGAEMRQRQLDRERLMQSIRRMELEGSLEPRNTFLDRAEA